MRYITITECPSNIVLISIDASIVHPPGAHQFDTKIKTGEENVSESGTATQKRMRQNRFLGFVP